MQQSKIQNFCEKVGVNIENYWKDLKNKISIIDCVGLLWKTTPLRPKNIIIT